MPSVQSVHSSLYERQRTLVGTRVVPTSVLLGDDTAVEAAGDRSPGKAASRTGMGGKTRRFAKILQHAHTPAGSLAQYVGSSTADTGNDSGDEVTASGQTEHPTRIRVLRLLARFARTPDGVLRLTSVADIVLQSM